MDERLTDVPHLPATVEFEQTRLRMPSRTDWIDPMVEYLRQRATLCGACQEARAAKLLLALHEALSNSIVHGNLELASALKDQGDHAFAAALAERSANPQFSSRPVEIVTTFDGEHYTWSFTDQGKGFAVEQVLGQAPPEGDAAPLASGRGILIMQAFLDQVRYELGGRRVILTLRKKSGEEKRLHARMPVQTRVRLIPIKKDRTVDWDAGYDAVARNFSQGGVTLVQNRPAPTDRLLIGFGGADKLIYLPVEICHRRALGIQVEELGCRFLFDLGPLAPDQVTAHSIEEADAALGAMIEKVDQQSAVAAERRTHPRFPYTERLQIEAQSGREPALGFARDLSKGGIAFITTAPLPLEVRVLGLPRSGGEPLRVRVLILRCTRIMEGFYDIGARFLALEASSYATLVQNSDASGDA
jgi:anti-sigma regulatory factor (Ser/Thr protein kinase)